jgi:CheY-like chemotaxis protein
MSSCSAASTVRLDSRQGTSETLSHLSRFSTHGELPAADHDALASPLCHDRVVRRTVLIVDDHAAFRAAASALLRADGYDIVGEAAEGTSALALTRRLGPDIVLLDVQLPGLDGFDVARQLADLPRTPAVVLVSSRDASAYGSRLAVAAVAGFLRKQALSGSALAELVG